METRPRPALIWALLAAGVAATMGLLACGPSAAPAPTTAPGPAPTPAASAAPAPPTAVPPAPTRAATAVPDPAATATPRARVIGLTPGPLVVEEHRIPFKGVDVPGGSEYRDRIDPMILEKRKALREVPLEQLMISTNETLQKFGLRLAKGEQPGCPVCVSFRLLKGEETIAGDISHFQLPTLNEKGDDFLMVVEARNGKSLLVRKAGAVPWEPMEHAYVPPTFLGDEVLSLWAPGLDRYEVRRGNAVLHAATPPEFQVDNPIKGLWSWQGHWALEVKGEVLVDGKSLNKEKGYDEVFDFRLVGGEPFYFFKKGNSIGMSYAGQELPQRYDEVIHYKCCEPAAFNPGGNDAMVWFHALRGQTWHYVEAGRFAPGALEAEIVFPSGYDLSRIRVAVDSPGWRFAVNSGAVKKLEAGSAYLFGLAGEDQAPAPGTVAITVEGVRGPNGATAPMRFFLNPAKR